MVADFRQFYGIDLPLAPTDGDCSRWALLWQALPRESRCCRRFHPEAEWSEGEYMLASCMHYLHLLARRQVTRDGAKGRNPPRPPRTPAQRAEAERRRDAALASQNEIAARLGYDPGNL